MGVEEMGGYVTNPETSLTQVREVVDAAIDNDMYVIIDWHTHYAQDYTANAVGFFEQMAREYGERILYPEAGTGAAGHWYVDRDGTITEYVPAERVAHHVRGWNPRSVGIELVNIGRFPHWYDSGHQAMAAPYPQAQVDALVRLLEHLAATLPGLRFIAGHEDLDTDRVQASDDPALTVARKVDPGPMFPWEDVLGRVSLERLIP